MPEQDMDRAAKVHRALDLLIRTMRMHHRNIEKHLEETNLHRSQRMLLMHLSCSKETPSQREIADKFDVSPACIARSLKSLAADGYITRIGDEEDQRRNHVCITEKGRLVIDQTRRQFEQFDLITFEGMTDAEISELIRLTEKLQTNLRTYEEALCEKNRPSKGSVSD